VIHANPPSASSEKTNAPAVAQDIVKLVASTR